ncbi:hypothetical protein ANACOL_02546 [Anaerotruncus colihominis DSM 17241]|uniref:Uncharacterized protein n=1 Tax=Anaerotruncus colihominis DSM 17241 TaxID=445972 RepID=B0PCN3_9FIRM|nr:hypothetical protein ANACOL_02546 [Anaerotruncus colihominis DSM 17241]
MQNASLYIFYILIYSIISKILKLFLCNDTNIKNYGGVFVR